MSERGRKHAYSSSLFSRRKPQTKSGFCHAENSISILKRKKNEAYQ
jgi:hypothetical protein